MNHKPLFIGNLKAYFATRDEADAYFLAYASHLFSQTLDNERDIALAVPYPHIRTAYETIKGDVRIGVQDISMYLPGAHTGEVSAELAQSEGAKFVILGHSERRAQGETDAHIETKIHRALDVKLEIVLCVGESRENRDSGSALIVIEKQLRSVLATISEKNISALTIAYEPVWAVGSDEVPSTEEVHEMIFGIRETLRQLFGDDSESVRVLYGGSVNAQNKQALITDAGADGALIGRASLDIKKFFEMIP